jgi:hypothetical protein
LNVAESVPQVSQNIPERAFLRVLSITTCEAERIAEIDGIPACKSVQIESTCESGGVFLREVIPSTGSVRFVFANPLVVRLLAGHAGDGSP